MWPIRGHITQNKKFGARKSRLPDNREISESTAFIEGTTPRPSAVRNYFPLTPRIPMVQNLHHAQAAQIIYQSLSAFLPLPSVNESFTCSIIFLGILGVNIRSNFSIQCFDRILIQNVWNHFSSDFFVLIKLLQFEIVPFLRSYFWTIFLDLIFRLFFTNFLFFYQTFPFFLSKISTKNFETFAKFRQNFV